MIKAVIEKKDDGTLITEFPCDVYKLYSEPQQSPPNKPKNKNNGGGTAAIYHSPCLA